MLAGIEAGGTKCVLNLADDAGQIVQIKRVPTEEPGKTILAMLSILSDWEREFGKIDSIVIGAFGPVNIDAQSPDYGLILNTPKVAWRGVNWITELQKGIDAKIGIVTDVMAAAWAEAQCGAGVNCQSVVYLTVGTGIGGAYVYKNELMGGVPHGEYGHMYLGKEEDDLAFNGICPSHGACWEGLASGPAMKARWGILAEELPKDHPAWDLEARYLARGLVNLIAILSPEKIIVGGGVGMAEGLLERVRGYVVHFAGDYFSLTNWKKNIESQIVLPKLGGLAGGKGTLLLAQNLK